MLTILQDLSDRFWDTRVWLPPNVTWNDIAPREDLPYTDHRHLAIPIPLACVMLIIRYFLEKLVHSYQYYLFIYFIIYLQLIHFFTQFDKNNILL